MNVSASNTGRAAIIGMSGRFPLSPTLDEFWDNLINARECITFATREELVHSRIDERRAGAANYVGARGRLDNIEMFDASLFGVDAMTAKLLDPQQRLLLECCWEACEHAGYVAEKSEMRGAVFVGQRTASYYNHNLKASGILSQPALNDRALRENSQHLLAARIARCLHLNGPAVVVQTACSSSLVAVHMAVQSLLRHECDIAIAGGVAVSLPQDTGYLYIEGSIGSPDGHVRAFDEKAAGTVGGNGVGVVVLRRLQDSVAEADTIHAVIRGTAINNDGNRKASYTAPSVQGQSEVIMEALDVSEIDAGDLSYVEMHGTGTALGDPLELRALQQAFRCRGEHGQYCGIGSVKTNIGHLDAAAGVAGLIKTVLALNHKVIPASLHCQTPTSKFDFRDSPFFVVAETMEWSAAKLPRRAGVSSFGMGGTNAHVIVEEPPSQKCEEKSTGAHLIPLSASTATALRQQRKNLRNLLQKSPVSLCSLAHTLQIGRRDLSHRTFEVAASPEEAIVRLGQGQEDDAVSIVSDNCRLIFLFLGRQAESIDGIAGLYHGNGIFRRLMTECFCHAERVMGNALSGGLDLLVKKEPLAKDSHGTGEAGSLLHMIAAYALAQLWRSYGLQPSAVIGYGRGELVAAVVAGTLSLEEMIRRAAQSDCLDAQPTIGVDDILFHPVAPGLPEQKKTEGRRPRSEGITSGGPLLYFLRPDGIESTRHLSLADFTQRRGLQSSPGCCLNIGFSPLFQLPSSQAKRIGTMHLFFPFTETYPQDADPALEILTTIGRLWQSGVRVDWRRFGEKNKAKTIPLPGYPFERQRYWLGLDDAIEELSPGMRG